MSEPNLIWRFGRWIARREGGTARLTWSHGELTVRVSRSKIFAIEGLDPQQLANEVGCRPAGQDDLLQEAQALATRLTVPETRVLAVVKRLLVAALRSWLLDEQRQLELTDDEPAAGQGPTISITHTLVELVLSDEDERLFSAILPDPDVLLRRHTSFLNLYAPLGLSEDADLIVAKITGQRTAREICLRSPHDTNEVVRLLTALVATGMLEPIPVAPATEELELLPHDVAATEIVRRPLPIGWIIAGAVAVVSMLGVVSVLISSGTGDPAPVPTNGAWSVVIDIGCDPQDYGRVLRKETQDPRNLDVVRAEQPIKEMQCWWLVWRRFPSQEAAEQSISEIPRSLVQDGFTPHVVQLPTAETDSGEQE